MIQFYTIINTILFLLSSLCMSVTEYDNRNCTLKLTSKTNPITGKVTFASKQEFAFKSEDGETEVALLIVRQNKELTLRFRSDQNICLPRAAEINFLTLDKKVLALKSNSRDNCNGTMIFNFGGIFGKEKARDILYERGILSLSFEDIDEGGYFLSVKDQQKAELQQVLQCLMNI